MKTYSNIKIWSMIALVFSVIIFSCNKNDDEDRPLTTEAINFINPDTTTIFADAGTTVDFNLYIALDKAIDTVRAAYSVDTMMSVTSLSFANADSVFFAQGYVDTNNVQYATGSIVLPQRAYDTIPFKPYFGGNTTPYIAPSYDAIRVVFKVEADDNRSIEKQLKIIIN